MDASRVKLPAPSAINVTFYLVLLYTSLLPSGFLSVFLYYSLFLLVFLFCLINISCTIIFEYFLGQ